MSAATGAQPASSLPNSPPRKNMESRSPVICFGGEVEAFDPYIARITKALSAETFVFIRKRSRQSYKASFEQDSILFKKIVPPQESDLKRRRSSNLLSLSTQASQIIQSCASSSGGRPIVFNLFIVHIIDDFTYQPKKCIFSDWLANAACLIDHLSPFFAIVLLVSDGGGVKLGKNTSKPACMDKVKSFYGFSKYPDHKFIYFFAPTSSMAATGAGAGAAAVSLSSVFSFEIFVSKLRELVVSAVNVLVSENEDLLKREWDGREENDWNIVSYFNLHHTLMKFYQSVKMYQAVKESYLELKAYVEQVLVNYRSGSSKPKWLQNLLLEQSSKWPGMTLNEAAMAKNKEDFLNETRKLSFLDLQNLIFSNLFFHYLRDADSMEKLFSVAVEFINFNRSLLTSCVAAESALCRYGIDCWAFVTAMSVLNFCKDEAHVNLFDFPTQTVILWEIASRCLEKLGKAVGLFSGGGSADQQQSSDQIQTGLEIMAGVEQRDHCATSLQLRKALSSKNNFDQKYEELITIVISTYKHKGRMRCACWKTVQLCEYLVANKKFELAAKYYADTALTYSNERWSEIEINVRNQLAYCQQNVNGNKVDPINVVANTLTERSCNENNNIYGKKDDDSIMKRLAPFSGTGAELVLSSSFLSTNAIQILNFSPLSPSAAAAAAMANLSNQQPNEAAAATAQQTTTTQQRQYSLCDLEGVTFFEVDLFSNFVDDLENVTIKWYYGYFDENVRFGYVRGNQLRFVKPSRYGSSETGTGGVRTSDGTSISGDLAIYNSATIYGSGAGRAEAETSVSSTDNKKLMWLGGEKQVDIKPGRQTHLVEGVFNTAGCYQLSKISVLVNKSITLNITPLNSLHFRVHNIAPKVAVKDVNKPIHSHVKSRISVVAQSVEWHNEYVLQEVTCRSAEVTLVSQNVILKSIPPTDKATFTRERKSQDSALTSKCSIVGSGEPRQLPSIEVEVEVFTHLLTDFHQVAFHWVVHKHDRSNSNPTNNASSKESQRHVINLTSVCKIPSMRPLTIVPQLLPAMEPPVMLLTVRNGSDKRLKLSQFKLQHRTLATHATGGHHASPEHKDKEAADKVWKDLKLRGPSTESEIEILENSRCRWCTFPDSFPISHELKLSCQYKTSDYYQNTVSWCSIFNVHTLIQSAKCQYTWMYVKKNFHQQPSPSAAVTAGTTASKLISKIGHISPHHHSTSPADIPPPIDLFKQSLSQGKSYMFTFSAHFPPSDSGKKLKFSYWVPSSSQWSVSGPNSRGSFVINEQISVTVTAKKPGDDLPFPEVIVKDDSNITAIVDLVDTSEFRRVKVSPKEPSAQNSHPRNASLSSPNTALGEGATGTGAESIVLRSSPSHRANTPSPAPSPRNH